MSGQRTAMGGTGAAHRRGRPRCICSAAARLTYGNRVGEPDREPVMPWFLVECLGPDDMTLVAVDGDPRDWTSASRKLESAAGVSVMGILERVRRDGEAIEPTRI